MKLVNELKSIRYLNKVEINKHCNEQMSLSLFTLEKQKKCAFKRGLETSRNVGYLFYYFLTM